MKHYFISILFIAVLFCQPHSTTVKIKYIGNMGVLIGNSHGTVLIDGLHKKYKKHYQYPSDSLVQRINNNAIKGFSPIRVVANTHIHKDHFDTNLVSQFLTKNKEAILVAPPQAKKELQTAKQWKKVKSQVKIVKKEAIKTIKKQKIKITGYYLNHIGARHKDIQNIGYLIEIDGFKVFHAGDTDINTSTYQKIGLHKKKVDVAILPNWMLMMDKGISIVNTYIQPKNIIATHIVPMDKTSVKKEIGKHFPKAILFTEVGEELKFSR